MNKPRLVFLLSEMLGWRSYARQLAAIAAERDDFTAVIRTYRYPRALAAVARRNNKSRMDWARPRLDPIDLAAFSLKTWWRDTLRTGPVAAAHAAGHTLGGVFAASAADVPFSLALDHTRAAMERDLPRGVWAPRHQAREARLFRAARWLEPMSHWAARSLIADCGCRAEAITVMPPSGTPSAFAAKRARDWPLPRVLFVGNDFERKGGERLISWFSGPLRGLAELHIVSSGAPAASAGPGIVVHGSVDHARLVSELYPVMDVFCLPTLSDMSPQVLMEAAMAGLPAVASDIAGIADLVKDGETGCLVGAGDDAAIIASLAELLSDPARCARLGTQARQYAEATLSAPDNFNALFDRMLGHGLRT